MNFVISIINKSLNLNEMRKSKNLMSLFMRASMTALLLILACGMYAQNITVKGSVKDVNGEPIIGANVHVVGTPTGVITNATGNYSINCSSKASLEFSYLGYDKQTIAVKGNRTVNVVLVESTNTLKEVVVTAMGIKKDAKKLGYAVSTVSSEDIVKVGSSNFATAIYGKAAGVRIQAAPGGNTSAVSINIRGYSSITNTTQPLIILDGMPIHNGDANNDGYWDNQRIRSNGLIDINPEDIANISILKGAAASALYGSEAANGVVMITTKSGNRGQKGIGVEFSANMAWECVAYMPEIQTEFGPGYPAPYWNTDYEKQTGGFFQRTIDGQSVKSFRTTSYQWGPKYDGSQVYYYDGSYRAYSPITKNQWNDVFRTGFDQTYNVAVTQGSEKGNLRFSYTYNNVLPTQYNSNNEKHNFNLTGSYNITKDLKIDYSANYMRQHIKNRPYRISRLIANYSGMFGSFDDIAYIRSKTMTSKGYEATYGTNASETPDENFPFRPYPWSLLDEYFWNIYGKVQIENNSRFMASVQPTWKIIDGLTFKARIATDLTTNELENEQRNARSLAFSNGGYYSLGNDKYEIYYGDAMLMYDKNITKKLNLTAMVGWQGRQESNYSSNVATSGGLTVENWYNLAASRLQANASMYKMQYLKTAFFGTLSLGYDNWAYVEGSARQEKTSTLHKGSNSYFYPSVNGSIIVSEMLKDSKPSWLDYGKVRVSYGIVGNAPAVYAASQGYQVSNIAGFVYNMVPSSLGNENIKPEKKYEFEVGIEGKFFKDRLGFEASYYSNDVKDQILRSTTPHSAGASSILLNVGELTNKGIELAVYGTPVMTKDWTWDLRANISHNSNKVKKLLNGVDKLSHFSSDGAVELLSNVGQPMGDWYCYTYKTGEKGETLIDDTGLPIADKTQMHKVGNAMPKVVGGFSTSLTYKNFRLDVTTDFRIGGDVWNTGYQYMMEIGNLKQTLPGREGHGGLDYYYANDDYNGNAIAGTAPSGATQYHDGVIIPGVTSAGAENKQIIPAGIYYSNTFGWGSAVTQTYQNSIQKNTYWKLRELAFSYTLPKSLTQKFACQRLMLSVFARNLFYLYKSIKDFDAEAADGTSWVYQSVLQGSTTSSRVFGFSLRASF